MKLSLMWRVLNTLDENWSLPLAEAILQDWRYDPGTIRFVRASANFVAKFQSGGKPYFLRFNECDERSRDAIEAEARLVAWLGEKGLRVAAPVLSKAGRYVETVETDLGHFNAVVFTGLEGPHIELEEMSLSHLHTWGAALGELHSAMKSYCDPSLAMRASWREHLELTRPYIDRGDALLLAEWGEIADWVTTLPANPDDFGMIHFDFESDNLCWKDDRVGILDFDDCAHYWYVADIAYALRDLFKVGTGFSVYGPIDYEDERLKSFLAGYRESTAINEELLSQLSMFLRLHGLYFYGRITRALDLPKGKELPAWLERLNAKLHSSLEAYRESLEAR